MFPSLCFLLLALLAAGCSGGAPESGTPKRSITIGLNPSEQSSNVQRNADVLAALISQRVGMPVTMRVAQDYSGLVEALRGGTVDFAFFAPVSYVFAERIADARVLLKAEREGRPFYYGCIVVKAEGPYRTIDNLRGRTIAWVDPTSASGHIFPKAALLDNGIDPDQFFARQTFAGKHDAVLLAVLNGSVDAGATYTNDTLGSSGSWTQLGDGAFRGKLRVILFSKPIPGDNMATSQRMVEKHPEIVAKVKRAVMGLTDTDEGRRLMKQMYHVEAMVPATTADYDPVRRAADMLHLDITGKIETDDTANETISTLVFAVLAALGIGMMAGRSIRARRRRRPVVEAAASTSGIGAIAHETQYAIRNLGVEFRDPAGSTFTALHNVSLDIGRGEFVAVIGLSGAGKSTFLRALNRTLAPTSGTIIYEGRDITHIDGRALIDVRRSVGFIFQQFNLVRTLTVLQNVLAGRLASTSWLRSMTGQFSRKDVEIARRYLRQVGLDEKVENRADRLSGGQQQRVAIARALAQEPRVILADEPMASLDPKLSEVVLDLLKRFNREEGITVIVNLHVLHLARRYADRVIAFRRGVVVFDGPPTSLTEEIVEEVYRTEDHELREM